MESTDELRTIEKHASSLKQTIVFCDSLQTFSDNLVEKAFLTRQGQNDILMNVSLSPLEKSGRLVDAVLCQVQLDPSKYEILVEILAQQAPLQSLAKQMKEHYAQCKVHAPPSREISHSSSDDTDSVMDFSCNSLEGKWALLIAELTEILTDYKNALMKMKTALQQRVRSKPVKKKDQKMIKQFSPILGSYKYKKAKNVDDLFTILAPYWNWKEYSLLELLVRASGCKPAWVKVREFIETRQAARHMVLQQSDAVQANPQQPSLASPSPVTSSAESGSEDSSESGDTVGLEMKMEKNKLTLEEYDVSASLVSRAIGVPRHCLTLQGMGTGCIAIRWRISSYLAKAVQRMTFPGTLLQEMALWGITHISIAHGSSFQLSVATVEYWGEIQKPQVDTITTPSGGDLQPDLMSEIQMDVEGQSPLDDMKTRMSVSPARMTDLEEQVTTLQRGNAELEEEVAMLQDSKAWLSNKVEALQQETDRLYCEMEVHGLKPRCPQIIFNRMHFKVNITRVVVVACLLLGFLLGTIVERFKADAYTLEYCHGEVRKLQFGNDVLKNEVKHLKALLKTDGDNLREELRTCQLKEISLKTTIVQLDEQAKQMETERNQLRKQVPRFELKVNTLNEVVEHLGKQVDMLEAKKDFYQHELRLCRLEVDSLVAQKRYLEFKFTALTQPEWTTDTLKLLSILFFISFICVLTCTVCAWIDNRRQREDSVHVASVSY